MATRAGKVKTLNWSLLKDGEARLSDLRKRDQEIAQIAIGLQMRTRITQLEGRVLHLEAMEQSWKMTRMSRLFVLVSKVLRKFRRILSK